MMPIPFDKVKALAGAKAAQRGQAHLDPLVIAKAVNAIPVGPIVNTLKSQESQESGIPFEKARGVAKEFLSLNKQRSQLARVVPTVASEISKGREDIDRSLRAARTRKALSALQPWDTFLGVARVGLSPVTGVIRPLLAEPAGMAAESLGGGAKARKAAEIGAEILGNLAVPGLGLPRVGRAAKSLSGR